jgi:hypothetical protein
VTGPSFPNADCFSDRALRTYYLPICVNPPLHSLLFTKIASFFLRINCLFLTCVLLFSPLSGAFKGAALFGTLLILLRSFTVVNSLSASNILLFRSLSRTSSLPINASAYVSSPYLGFFLCLSFPLPKEMSPSSLLVNF